LLILLLWIATKALEVALGQLVVEALVVANAGVDSSAATATAAASAANSASYF
jgi:hypothetical protein